jgi:hypothetical protein
VFLLLSFSLFLYTLLLPLCEKEGRREGEGMRGEGTKSGRKMRMKMR